jgi:tRNA (cytidine/uridine-2'-O-)-methyltransferase
MALHVALVEPEIHWNTGNAGRTCLGAAAQLHLIGPMGFSLGAAQVRRSGLDYWERVNPRVWESWSVFAKALPELGEPFFLTPDAPRRLWDVRFPSRVVLVLGRESVGLPASLKEQHKDRLIALPMLDASLRSLNLSTCVGIAAYEVRRQWEAASLP